MQGGQKVLFGGGAYDAFLHPQREIEVFLPVSRWCGRERIDLP